MVMAYTTLVILMHFTLWNGKRAKSDGAVQTPSPRWLCRARMAPLCRLPVCPAPAMAPLWITRCARS